MTNQQQLLNPCMALSVSVSVSVSVWVSVLSAVPQVGFAPYAGIMVGWQNGLGSNTPSHIFEVGHNKIHDYGLGILSDFGGIYLSSEDNLCFQKSPETCWLPALVHDNDILKCEHFNYGCEGIYMDEQVSPMQLGVCVCRIVANCSIPNAKYARMAAANCQMHKC